MKVSESYQKSSRRLVLFTTCRLLHNFRNLQGLLFHNGLFKVAAQMSQFFSECIRYVVDSALKVRRKEEQRHLQTSVEWLTTECDILRQCCNNQALDMFGRR